MLSSSGPEVTPHTEEDEGAHASAGAPVWDRAAATQGDTSKDFGRKGGFFSICGKEDGTTLALKPPQGGASRP